MRQVRLIGNTEGLEIEGQSNGEPYVTEDSNEAELSSAKQQ